MTARTWYGVILVLASGAVMSASGMSMLSTAGVTLCACGAAYICSKD